MSKHLKEIHWEGDSKEVLSDFPLGVRRDIGYDLYALQIGREPHDSRPMKSVSPGVYELRTKDSRSWYRVMYYIKIDNKIYVLHSFEKKSAKTPKNDIEVTKKRLKKLIERLRK